MKSLLASLLITVSLISCKSDDGGTVNNNNPFLNSPIVNISLNLNLPEYNPLRFPGNSVLINNRGIKGIVVYNLNNTLYTAFDLSDPNHIPNSCSRMDVEGIVATCPCENENGTNSYDIVTGQHQNDTEAFPMQVYRAERTGNVVTISN